MRRYTDIRERDLERERSDREQAHGVGGRKQRFKEGGTDGLSKLP